MREAMRLLQPARGSRGRASLEQSQDDRISLRCAAVLIVVLSILCWLILIFSGLALWSRVA